MYTEQNSVFITSDYIDIPEVCGLSDIHHGKGNVVISSDGGEFLAFLMAKDILHGRVVTTVGSGSVFSTALDIFLLGEKRLATPDTRFLMHRSRYIENGRPVCACEALMMAEISMLENKPLSANEQNAVALALERCDHIAANLIATRTRLEIDRAMAMMDGDGTYLSLRDALAYGFVNEVIPATMVAL